MANHYVRQGATGSANGSDWTNAWTDLPTSFTRGDTYYVADGDYGSHMFDQSASGSTWIYIKKATSTDHGTETGWDSAYGDGTATFSGPMPITTNYWSIDGQSRTTKTSGYGFKVSGLAANQTAFSITAASNVTLKYIEIEHRGRNYATSDRGVGMTSSQSNINLQYLYIHDISGPPIISRVCSDILVEHCYFARNSSEAANHSELWSGSTDDNVTFRYNVCEDIEGSAVIFLGNGSGAADNWQVYGNVFYWSSDYGVSPNSEGVARLIYVAHDSPGSQEIVATNWRVYNNTIVNAYGLGSGFFFEDSSSTVESRNNLWYGTLAPNHANPGISYSWYYGCTHTDDTTQVQDGTGDPFVDLDGEDFHLAANTTAGQDLGAGYDEDMDGVARTTWSRGAYEYTTTEVSGTGVFRMVF